ncbi:MAG: DUF2089 family protein [Phycisphaerae bacterium]|nr:DUF2089 family protein [Phycisphaerae bacterium]
MSESQTNARRWVDHLEDEDLAFIKRFVLASGSLKELAQAYGISYPTVRLRLDRLIEKIKLWDSQEISSEFEKVLRVQYAEGKIDMGTVKTLLAAHKRELGDRHDQTNTES